MAREEEAPPSACPVDHKSRAAWLEHAEAQRPAQNSSKSPLPVGETCDSSQVDQSTSKDSPLQLPSFLRGPRLATDREVSTIPRALPKATKDGKRLANNEQETGADKSSGNWIYPSEQMFFNAMRRKNYNPQAEDMRSIIPIHNAVNERAWKEIKEWEKGRGADAYGSTLVSNEVIVTEHSCGGPRLESFSGSATSLTPKARLNTFMGYSAPFDRHDWVVDRCGKKVEYVIDFYAGKDEKKPGKSLNFYLDVRPKLNSLEGWKMRAGRLVGL
ncbi:Cytochrome c1 heme lyase [Coniosporium apollinis]|uniref:Holocytochrome c-type synthase n=2 Tax=Coniosporium TaxID=2810619 RepID=A0ABQ9NV37_9PEZI|nr:Cytochrome c1 heme lyase [Cladosporium sp. JES 115]KAJ9665134.1 Cytochrome c1 heme lyase [Coniosporium apollinis]